MQGASTSIAQSVRAHQVHRMCACTSSALNARSRTRSVGAHQVHKCASTANAWNTRAQQTHGMLVDIQHLKGTCTSTTQGACAHQVHRTCAYIKHTRCAFHIKHISGGRSSKAHQVRVHTEHTKCTYISNTRSVWAHPAPVGHVQINCTRSACTSGAQNVYVRQAHQMHVTHQVHKMLVLIKFIMCVCTSCARSACNINRLEYACTQRA